MKEREKEQLRKISFEHEQLKKQLEDREKELREREAMNDTEQRKLDIERNMVLRCVTKEIFVNLLYFSAV